MAGTESTEKIQVLGKDANGMDKVMTKKDYAGDAVGQISMNTINSFSGQMTYFYTTKVGMAAGASGTIILVSKIVDGVSDLIMGRIVDKTQSKDGKARFWLKMMIIPTLISMILLFTVPHIGATGQMIYGILTNILASAIVYTAIAVPYYTMINYETRSLEERGKIGTYRGFVGYIIGILIGMTLLPFTNALGGTQRSWVIVAAVFGLFGAITLAVCFKSTKERYSSTEKTKADEADEKLTTAESLKYLVRNKYWWMMAVAQMAVGAIYTFLGGGLAFYAQFVLGNDNLTALISMIGLVPSVIGFVITPMMITKIGMRKTGIIAAVIGLAGTVLRYFAPDNFTVFTVGYCLVMFATAPIVAVLPAMVINCAEWNDYRYGVKITGMTNSVASAGMKIGVGLAGAGLGWILAAGGFDSLSAVQPESAIRSIYALNITWPGIMLVIIAVCYGLYGLEKKYPEIARANAERRAKMEEE